DLKKLRRALRGPTDRRQKSRHLLARNQAQRAARRAGEHRPIGVFSLPHFARILQHEHGTGFHLLGNPFVDNAQLTDHHASPAFPFTLALRSLGYVLRTTLFDPAARAELVPKPQPSCAPESPLE